MTAQQIEAISDTKNEQQSYKDAAALVLHAFSCVAYIREFFGEDAFVDCKFGDMTLKKIYRGVTRGADMLMDWIDRGVQDALKHKYLETVTMGIFSDPKNPQDVIETYTMGFSYPSSRQHEMIMRLRSNTHRGDNQGIPTVATSRITASLDAPFKQQMIKMLRTLCILMQTLGPLPKKRYVAMQMTYYDEVTPVNYEPPCFTSSVFELNYLFKDSGSTFKHDFGAVASPYHRVRLAFETLVGGDKETTEKEKHEEICKDAGVPNNAVPEAKVDEAQNTQDTIVMVPEAAKAVVPKEEVSCLCGDSNSDLDMICCDRCSKWQHTPCMGFCTNRDKRIPEKYVCLACVHSENKKLLKNLEELAVFRRVISIAFSEGLQSITWLSKRLDCGLTKASRLIRRLESEGLVSKPDSQAKVYHYDVHKTAEAKEKIRYFFGLDLAAFPELRPYFGPAANKTITKKHKALDNPAKRRKSTTAEHIYCAC